MAYRRKRMSYSRNAKRGRSSSASRRMTKKRKTPTKKRKTTKKKSTKVVDPNLASYVNPFSNLTSQPKIPDGKPTESVGITYRDVTQVTQDNASTPLVFALVPALGYCCLVQNDEVAQSLTSRPAEQRLNIRKFDSCPGVLQSGALPQGPVSDGTTINHSNDEVAHWRMVSAGLRISLLNAAEEDDGWWEASQFVIDDEADFWSIIPYSTFGPFQQFFVPNGQIYNNRGGDISNQRTYKTGLLRDLHKHMFRCKPCMETHDFQDLRGGYRLDSGEMQYDQTAESLEIANGSQSFRHMSDELIDTSYQMILIRCYGRGGTNKSRFHVDSQANYEFIYSRDANESKFHTTAASNPAFPDVTKGLRADPSPSINMSMD